MRIFTAVFILCSFLLISCFFKRPDPNGNDLNYSVYGYKAIYTSDTAALNVRYDTARAVKAPGKIYTIGNKIFQNELGYGIHVLDKSNLPQVTKSGFIHILGNTEMSMKGNYMYANSFDDLLVIDISNFQQPVVVKKLLKAFDGGQVRRQPYIPLPSVGLPYECLRSKDSIQIGWKQDSLRGAFCY